MSSIEETGTRFEACWEEDDEAEAPAADVGSGTAGEREGWERLRVRGVGREEEEEAVEEERRG